MTRGARRLRSAAALLALGVVASGCTFRGVSSLPLPGGVDTGPHPYEVKMVFENVLDLVVGGASVGTPMARVTEPTDGRRPATRSTSTMGRRSPG